MDVFTLVSCLIVFGLVAATVLLGLFSKRSALDILDWKPTRSPQVEAENELDDLEQMIEAQNEIRRRLGKPERSLEDVEAEWHGILIVPCGARGQALARELRAAGHAVRGTTRGAHVAEIAATGAEPYVGDPDRIATLMEALHGVTIVCWLTGTIPDPDLHAGRLRMLWEKLVDTPVRGVVYEGMFPEGEAIARGASDVWQIPLEVLSGDPRGDAWVTEAVAAVDRLLS